jgi:uncharacterized protein (TIGR03118 family)
MRQVWRTAVAACVGLVVLVVSAPAHAQYQLTTLVSNQLDDNAPNTDPLLVNPWGLARSATSPWWVSDNISGWATVYGPTGTIVSLKVLIPTAGDGPVSPKGTNGPGTPTGMVSDGVAADFAIGGVSPSFIFATLDGTISAFEGSVNRNLATILYTSTDSAMYTGLAITNNATGKGLNFLYAADNTNNKIDAFQVASGVLTLEKSFGDPSIPTSFSVFGVQDINGLVYVTYAATNGGADGFVDVFTEAGALVKPLIQGRPLNQAWGVVLAPSNFGPLSNTLLISNNSIPGTINGFNPTTGEFVGTIRDQHERPISFNQAWAVAFGSGNVNATTGASDNGAANELFVTVGPGNAGQPENAGIFASIVFNPINNRDHDRDHDHDHDDDGRW